MKKHILPLAALLALASCSPSDCQKNDNECQNAAVITPADALEQSIMGRRSIRKYTEQTVSRDIIDRLLRLGINAPSGMNKQSYEIRVINNPGLVTAISDAVVNDTPEMGARPGFKNIFAGAKCVIFIANDTHYDCSQIDCGLLGQNIMLAAHSLGLGTCCMAYPVRQMRESKSCASYLDLLGFSEGYNLLYCIALGYPDEAPDAKPRRDDMIRFVNIEK